MNNEKDIKQRFGTANHFTVPEGYFDNFASQMMSRLPEREARVVEIKQWLRQVLPLWPWVLPCGSIKTIHLHRRSARQRPPQCHCRLPQSSSRRPIMPCSMLLTCMHSWQANKLDIIL